MPFADRSDAGRKLVAALTRYKNARPVVLALPRGGVPVAAEISKAFNAPLDLILVRKIGVPYQPELAMGAVADAAEPFVVRNEAVLAESGVTEEEFASVRDKELKEIARRRERYLGSRGHCSLAGRIVIVVDDGIATGSTMRAALAAVRAQRPAKLVLAVPVAPGSTLQELHREVDDLICLEEHDVFGAIGYYYADFRQVSDSEVVRLLSSASIAEPSSSGGKQ